MKNRPRYECASFLRTLVFLAVSMLTGGCIHNVIVAQERDGAADQEASREDWPSSDLAEVADSAPDVGPDVDAPTDIVADTVDVYQQRSCPRRDARGCGLVAIRGGTSPAFALGTDQPCPADGGVGAGSCQLHASPAQPGVTVQDFAMDQYEVTVARFRIFWEAVSASRSEEDARIRRSGAGIVYRGDAVIAWSAVGPYAPPLYTADQIDGGGASQAAECNWTVAMGSPPSGGGIEYHPINCVDWSTAQEFCVWDAGEGTYGTERNGRLPTEAEWEYAARWRAEAGVADAPRDYPWGANPPSPGGLLVRWRGDLIDGRRTAPVGSYPNGRSGELYDMGGNLWEYTADEYHEYSETPGTKQCPLPPAGMRDPVCRVGIAQNERVIRGGGYPEDHAVRFRTVSRTRASGPFHSVGFRCVRGI